MSDLSFHPLSHHPSYTFSSIVLNVLLIAGGAATGWAQSNEEVNTTIIRQPADAIPTSSSSVSPPERSARPLRADVDLVLVPVTVSDAKNRPVLELGKKDFALYEAGKQQDIKYFFAENEPISIGLVLDLSMSMTSKIQRERDAVVQFFQNANPQDDYFAIAVSSEPRLMLDATQSLEQLQSKLGVEVPQGRTALLDSIALGLARLRSARYSRRALLIISDGGDNSSRYLLREIKSLVSESNVDVYAIGLFDSGIFRSYEEFMGKRWLREITDSSGGRTVTVDSVDKLPEAAAEISREMRQQYVLGYQPSPTAAREPWHKIKVKVLSSTAQHPLTPFYRKGYFGHVK
jgi:Ca-activated chloride channel homolog